MQQASPIGVLLIGPTGAGKTPLGESLATQQCGYWRFHHFDFGQHLRNIASGLDSRCLFDESERQLIREILSSGRLLEDEEFFIADRLLRSFLSQLPKELHRTDVVVLNGLPRNVFQAQCVDRVKVISVVVTLECDQNVVFQRIRSNVGGDRIGRCDDRFDLIVKRSATYESETRPVRDYYKARGVPTFQLLVTASTTPKELCCSFLDHWDKLFGNKLPAKPVS